MNATTVNSKVREGGRKEEIKSEHDGEKKWRKSIWIYYNKRNNFVFMDTNYYV